MDLDDTLLDHQGFPESLRATCELIAETYDGFDASKLLVANTAAWTEYWPEVEESVLLGRVDGATVSLEAWRRTLEACGSTDPSIVRFAFERQRRLGHEALRLYPDAADVLACIRELDIPAGVITNGPADLQRDKLRTLGLDALLDVVVISGEIGAAKPDPAPFRLAMDRLRVQADEVWHVGDSLVTDVAGARAAGVTAVWINRRGEVRTKDDAIPDLEIRSLHELIGRLRPATFSTTGS